MKVSSTSTSPLSRSTEVRPIAVRSLWHIAQAVSYDPSPSNGCSEAALTPFVVTAISQAASNQTVSGVRVSWKIVPARTRTDSLAAASARPATGWEPPALLGAAVRAPEAVRPPQPVEVVQARRVVREPGAHSGEVARIVDPGLRRAYRHAYKLLPSSG